VTIFFWKNSVFLTTTQKTEELVCDNIKALKARVSLEAPSISAVLQAVDWYTVTAESVLKLAIFVVESNKPQ
jgi:hypothetical protein